MEETRITSLSKDVLAYLMLKLQGKDLSALSCACKMLDNVFRSRRELLSIRNFSRLHRGLLRPGILSDASWVRTIHTAPGASYIRGQFVDENSVVLWEAGKGGFFNIALNDEAEGSTEAKRLRCTHTFNTQTYHIYSASTYVECEPGGRLECNSPVVQVLPLNQYVCVLSEDKKLHIFDLVTKESKEQFDDVSSACVVGDRVFFILPTATEPLRSWCAADKNFAVCAGIAADSVQAAGSRMLVIKGNQWSLLETNGKEHEGDSLRGTILANNDWCVERSVLDEIRLTKLPEIIIDGDRYRSFSLRKQPVFKELGYGQGITVEKMKLQGDWVLMWLSAGPTGKPADKHFVQLVHLPTAFSKDQFSDQSLAITPLEALVGSGGYPIDMRLSDVERPVPKLDLLIERGPGWRQPNKTTTEWITVLFDGKWNKEEEAKRLYDQQVRTVTVYSTATLAVAAVAAAVILLPTTLYVAYRASKLAIATLFLAMGIANKNASNIRTAVELIKDNPVDIIYGVAAAGIAWSSRAAYYTYVNPRRGERPAAPA